MHLYKKMTNVEIVELLSAVAAAYKVKSPDKDRFKVIAYERAADAVEHLSSEAKDLWDEGKLTEVSGIGKSIAGHLDEIFRTGKSKHFEKVLSGLPPAMFELLKVNGIGAKTAYRLSTEFDIPGRDPLKSLKKIVESGKIAELEGFGKDSEESILKSISEVQGRVVRILLPYATQIADNISEWMKKDKNVVRVDALGSLRRRASTVGDVDMAAATINLAKTIEHFTKYPKKSRVLEQGDRTASIIVPGGRQVDLMVESPEAYGALLQHFTGSKHHNISLRKLAIKMGYSVSDYGIKKLRTKNGKRPSFAKATTGKKAKIESSQYIKVRTEEELYRKLGMEWIAPELREDRGEIEASLDNKLPKLIELSDVKGDLQIHSDYDIETSHDVGSSSMEEIVKKAGELGYEYVALTEHNPSKSGHNGKQITEILKKKQEVVGKLNQELGIKTRHKPKHVGGQASVRRVFNSLEIDMLTEGGLPVSDEGLETLDFALVSIHSSFRLSRAKMTERVLKSLEHPTVKIFAHPTGRKLNEREGVELDWEKIFEYCLEHDKWVEINAAPSRLDLPDVLVHDAVKLGVKLTLGTDAHEVSQMDNMRYGVSVARRGWAQKGDIVNTRNLREFEKLVAGSR